MQKRSVWDKDSFPAGMQCCSEGCGSTVSDFVHTCVEMRKKRSPAFACHWLSSSPALFFFFKAFQSLVGTHTPPPPVCLFLSEAAWQQQPTETQQEAQMLPFPVSETSSQGLKEQKCIHSETARNLDIHPLSLGEHQCSVNIQGYANQFPWPDTHQLSMRTIFYPVSSRSQPTGGAAHTQGFPFPAMPYANQLQKHLPRYPQHCALQISLLSLHPTKLVKLIIIKIQNK